MIYFRLEQRSESRTAPDMPTSGGRVPDTAELQVSFSSAVHLVTKHPRIKNLAALCRDKLDLASELRHACKIGDIGLIEVLVKNGADPNCFVNLPTHLEWEPFRSSPSPAFSATSDLVSCLLVHGANPAFWMLELAFDRGHDEILRVMCKHFDVDTISEKNGQSLLQRSCWALDVASVDLLISLDADVHKVDTDGLPPLVLAFIGDGDPDSQSAVMARLLTAGADVETGGLGWTPLAMACHWDNLEAVSFLLDHGPNPDARQPRETSPLLISCAEHVRIEIFAKLVDRVAVVPFERALQFIGDGGRPIPPKANYIVMAWHKEVSRPIVTKFYRP